MENLMNNNGTTSFIIKHKIGQGWGNSYREILCHNVDFQIYQNGDGIHCVIKAIGQGRDGVLRIPIQSTINKIKEMKCNMNEITEIHYEITYNKNDIEMNKQKAKDYVSNSMMKQSRMEYIGSLPENY